MTTPDELQRAVERLKNAARNNDGTLIDKDYGEVFVCVSDLHLANEILSERAELLATVEMMLDALRLAVGPLGSTGPTPVYEAVLAAILKATTPNAGERG